GAVTAQVIGTALEQGGTYTYPQRLLQAWQVTVEQLVLQRAGAGGNDAALARQQHRHQVGESLAGTGTGLGQQHVHLLDRGGNGRGQLLLGRARGETVEDVGQRTTGGQRRGGAGFQQ